MDPWMDGFGSLKGSKDWGFCIVHIDKNEQKMRESDVLLITTLFRTHYIVYVRLSAAIVKNIYIQFKM